MATLKSLVNETTNIKDELKTCHTNLKNNLIAKGVECSDTDKMSSLIDKITLIPSIPLPIKAGNDLNILYDEGRYGANSNYSMPVMSFSDFKYFGSYRISLDYGCPSSHSTNIGIKHLSSGSVIRFEEFSSGNGGTYRKATYDFDNISKGDIIEFYCYHSSHEGTYFAIKNITISCEFKL